MLTCVHLYDNLNLRNEGDNMKINKAYKFRLYPNNEQKKLINKTFGMNLINGLVLLMRIN